MASMNLLEGYLINLGLSEDLTTLILRASGVAFLLTLAILTHVLTKSIIMRVVGSWVKKTKTKWDDLIFEKKIIPRLSQIVPVVVVAVLSPLVFEGDAFYTQLVDKFVAVYLIILVMMILDAVLNLVEAVLGTRPFAQRLPLKGILQAIKLIGTLVGVILVISELMDESPIALFSGLGAMTAVLLLIFREAILGFVAGVQLSANNLVQKGDWIAMPKYGADGDVVDVTLTTVLVQNWDKTITSIPAYALIQDSFKNYRNMEKVVKGRRIKRSLYIDQSSVMTLSQEVTERFGKYKFLKAYIEQKREEIQAHNAMLEDDANLRVDGRALTNVGTFRAYCLAYLKNHPEIRQDLTLLVRQLDPTPQGLPLQVYCFTKDTRWAVYEGIQADIFDHLIAVAPEFQLRLFQSPSGLDLRDLVQSAADPS